MLRGFDLGWLPDKCPGILLSAIAPWYCCQLGTRQWLSNASAEPTVQETHPSPAPTLSLPAEVPLLLPVNDNGVCISFGVPNPQLVRSICTHAKGRLIITRYFSRHDFPSVARSSSYGRWKDSGQTFVWVFEQHRSDVGMPWFLASTLALLGSGVIIFSFIKNKGRATVTQLNLEFVHVRGLFTHGLFSHSFREKPELHWGQNKFCYPDVSLPPPFSLNALFYGKYYTALC